MELNTTLEATVCVATLEIPRISWIPKVYHHNRKSLSNSPYPEPGQSSPHHLILSLRDPPTYDIFFLMVSFALNVIG
jgi:hypothetical protein